MKHVWICLIVLGVIGRVILLVMRNQDRQIQHHYNEYQERERERFRSAEPAYSDEAMAVGRMSRTAYYDSLVELGYLKYTEPADTLAIHIGFLSDSCYKESDYALPTLYTTENKLPLDRRYYPCHGGLVYMEGGLVKLIGQLSPTFQKMGFTCAASNQRRVWSPENKWTNETIVINGRTYITLKDFTGLGYKEAPARFAEIINEELKRQHKAERIYLVSSAEKGQLAILTPELQQFLDLRSHNDFHTPLAVTDWRDLQAR